VSAVLLAMLMSELILIVPVESAECGVHYPTRN